MFITKVMIILWTKVEPSIDVDETSATYQSINLL